MGVFQVIYLGASADEAYQRVQPLQPFAPFRDASCGPPSFNLSVQHCIQVAQHPKCSNQPQHQHYVHDNPNAGMVLNAAQPFKILYR